MRHQGRTPAAAQAQDDPFREVDEGSLEELPETTATRAEELPRGYTVPEVARRYRVGQDKVRGWIRRGELAAVNTAAVLCGKPRWVITPDALAAFEKLRAGGPTPKPSRSRRQPVVIDFYPDVPG
jgi:hypothetical protein